MSPYHTTLRPNEVFSIPDKLVECPDCNGEGAIMVGIVVWKCDFCNGKGMVTEDSIRTRRYHKS